jgi:hypothetical protein
MIMLFWETIQCNKRFRAFIVDTDRGHDFIVLLLFYAIENRTDPTKQGIVRMCVFVIQTLSVEKKFATGLNQVFNKQETLPASIRIEDWQGTYGDFLVVVCILLVTDVATLTRFSQYIHLLPVAKESSMRSIQRYSRSSTTLPLIWRT